MLNNRRSFLAIFCVSVFLLFGVVTSLSAFPPVLVYVTASAADALKEVSLEFQRVHKYRVKVVADASSTLAHKIEAGDATNLFISDSGKWIDYLKKADLIFPETVTPLFSNSRITYQAAVISRFKNKPARLFLKFLQGEQAKKILKKHRFQPVSVQK